MTIMIKDGQIERLVQKLATAQGISTGDVVRESVLALAKMRGVANEQPPLRERLAKLALEIAALPKAAPVEQVDDAIWGYDEQGTVCRTL